MKKDVIRYFMPAYATITSIILIFLLFSFGNIRESFNEISVKRINIVDDKGIARIVISNEEFMPDPIVGGKAYNRRIAPAGIIFYDEKGNEGGGMALANLNGTGLRALAFDYADAIGLIAQENRNGKDFTAGILINDKDLSGKPGSNISRLRLTTENGNAGLIINGPDEQPRISILVDSLGNPSIQVFDKDGKLRI